MKDSENYDYGSHDPGDAVVAPPSRTQARSGPWQAEILHVTGRGSDETRGLAPVHSMTVSHRDGHPLTFGRDIAGDVEELRVQVLGTPRCRDFAACPICGSARELTREHVPQQNLGGTVMTKTCRSCNNGLGSRVENELQDWFDDALVQVRFSGGGVLGKRKVPRILRRSTAEGEFVLFVDAGEVDPQIQEMLASGEVAIEYRNPDPAVWRLAALKHAYLGACLALGGVPTGLHAEQVRADLVAARDCVRGEPFPGSRMANGLRVARSFGPAHGPSVELVALLNETGEPQDYGLAFAGTLFVSWPLAPALFWDAARRLSALGRDAK